MTILGKLYITALVICRSLAPSRPESAPPGGADAAPPPPGYRAVPAGEISRYLADLSRAVGKDGKLALFFPGCRAAAAPFVLFRLKREGYSNCGATATADGLLLKASR